MLCQQPICLLMGDLLEKGSQLSPGTTSDALLFSCSRAEVQIVDLSDRRQM